VVGLVKSLKNYWRIARDDIKTGRGLEIWLAVPLAVIAIILSLMGVTSTKLTISLVGVLIIATSLGQLEIKDLLTKVSDMADLSRNNVVVSTQRPFDLSEMLGQTRDLYLGGLDLFRTFANNEREILDFLRLGGKLRVLIYSPTGSTLENAVERSKKPWSADRQRVLIENTIDDFQNLRTANPSLNVTIRVSTFPFHMGFGCFEPGTDRERMFLKYYAYRADSYDGPWFILDNSDEEALQQFNQEIEALWENSSEPNKKS